ATLEELETADVLVHVLDVTHARGYEQGLAVARILDSLGVANKPVVTALNKIDRLDGVAGPVDGLDGVVGESLRLLADNYPPAVPISAARGWGLDQLLHGIECTLLAAGAQGLCPLVPGAGRTHRSAPTVACCTSGPMCPPSYMVY